MEPAEERFAQRLPEYLASLEGASEDGRRILFLNLLRDIFGVDLARFQIEERIYGGEVDAILGALVFEFKRDLGRTQDDAEAQLSRYITELHKKYSGRSFTAVATDGVRILAFSPEYNAQGHVTALTPTGERDLARMGQNAPDIYLWLDSLISTFRERRPATTQSVVAGLGPASPVFRTALANLHSLFTLLQDQPALQLRISQWRRYLALVYGEETGNTELFLKHTYLALVARLLASLRPGIGTLPSPKDLAGIIQGDYFHDRAALANFVEEDFFTWPLLEPVRQEGLALAQRLLNTLQTYDFSQVREDVLKELYQGLVDPADRHDLGEYYTPDWLAELMLRDELRLAEDPRRSLLDPSCGSGTFLFIAMRLIREALEKQGVAPAEILYHIVGNVVGMDVHPLAVTIARTNYLLALGDLLHAKRDVISIPVYLADSIKLPETTSVFTSPPIPASGRGSEEVRSTPRRSAEGAALAGGTGVSHKSSSSPSHVGEGDRGGEVGSSYAIEAEPNVFLQVPQAMNSEGLDYLLPFMKDKYGRATIARAATAEAEARGWYAFHNFLVARGNRRKPFALSQDDARVVMETQRVLVSRMREGKDTLWFFILRNSLRPVYLAQQKFDLVVGNPPWLSLRYVRNPDYYQWVRGQILREYRLLESSRPHLFTQMELATLFFARAADLYLKDGGQIAFVMPRSVMVAQQHARFTSMSFKEGIDPSPRPPPRIGEGERGGGVNGGLLTLGLRKLLDLEGVSPLFNVPACVLVAEKGKWPEYPVPGTALSGDLAVKNHSLAAARALIQMQPTTYQRVDGRLVAEGSLSPLTLSEFTLSAAEGKGLSGVDRSYYYDKFYQGATIVPRNLWFVHLVAGRYGFSQEAPFFETDPEGTRQAKAPWKDVRMEGNVEARFLYATLPSGGLVPFGYTRLSPVILPLIEEGGRYRLLDVDGAMERGHYRLAEWLRQAQGHWERLARKGAGGLPKVRSVVDWLNYRSKLTTQSPRARYRMLYNAAGTNLCAAVVDANKATGVPINGETFQVSGFLCEHKMYVFYTDDASEANFLQAVFNAPILDALIKPSQTVGLWGERDIEKRAVQFPIPQFDPRNATHVRLAELGQRCAERVAEVIPEMASHYRSVGRLRGEVRRLLSAELAEIDALARRMLGS